MNYFVNTSAMGYDTYVIPCLTEGLAQLDADVIGSDVVTAVDVILKDEKISETPKSYQVVIGSKLVNLILFTFNNETLRTKVLQLGAVYKKCLSVKAGKVAFMCSNTPDSFVTFEELEKTFELPYLVSYKFDEFLSEPSKIQSLDVDYFLTDTQEVNAKSAMMEAVASAKGICIARDAVNYPTSHMSPQDFAKLSIDKGLEYGFETEVIDENALKEMGAEALLAVGAGSKNPPVMVVMRYQGAPESKEKYALVGKGIMYDSGGYSIKPRLGMVSMHTDMGGAAAVLGTMCVATSMKLKVNIVAIVPACENLVGENAYLPGTIIGSLLGRTSEIISTDGEGRLVLADGLTYAWQTEKATTLIDIATLTGGAIAAVGNKSGVGITTCEDLWSKTWTASSNSAEKIWRLDLDEELRENLKSFRADSKNTPSGGKPGASILGALFLRPFTNKLPWLHVDMAPVAWSTSDIPTGPKGATGYGVSLLYNLLKGLEEK